MQGVVEAAVELADEKGMAEVTLASLAKKLGIRTPSLYNHVGGLEDLRKRMAFYGVNELYASLSEAVRGNSGEEGVKALAAAYVQFARERPGLYQAAQHAPDRQDDEMVKAYERVVNLVVTVMNHYGLEGDAKIHAVRGIRSILHGFTSLELTGGFGIPLDLDVSLRLAIDAYLAGISVMKDLAIKE
ncbi:TetR-like C-terminal domain-containing protein [Gorillibacterium massiliense]|uniref:TetR-like C-terminal domain-containing protein n=1 Tax=Gorillibacterium massiliense TaxID=1280390 RepID=UPI0004B9D0D1